MDPNIDEFATVDPLVIEYYAMSGEPQFKSDFFILMEHKLAISNDALIHIFK